MSLDLSSKQGVAYSTAAIVSPAAFAASIFNAAEFGASSKYVVKCDTTASNFDVSILGTPVNLGFQDGDIVTFLKVTSDGNLITLNDTNAAVTAPVAMAASNGFNHASGVAYSFVNQMGEGISIYADCSNNKWGVAI